jgi:hypothetical protein
MTSSAEIETIVRRVLATLTATAAPSSEVPVSSDSNTATLRLSERVISIQTIKDKLSNHQVLEYGRMSVVTPAAKDYCRERKITLVRSDIASGSIGRSVQATGSPATSVQALVNSSASAGQTIEAKSETRPQRLLVTGSTTWMDAVAKQLCSRQSKVEKSFADDASAMRRIADGLREGHQAGVAIVDSPHAACWQAARDDRLRPAVVANWMELGDVLREVPVNVLILSSKTWNCPSVCNGARRFFEHLKNNS